MSNSLWSDVYYGINIYEYYMSVLISCFDDMVRLIIFGEK